ncbi:MAG: flagellar basal-body rod protein FlgG [Rhizobiales bacterium PAR1]|nr:MAG: flagellar basal-body rod protein FlgG [Rhizobiales bacterium PAR1]
MRALYTAATGMAAQEKNVEVIANNVANMRTTGFKRQTVHFQDLIYEQQRRAGSPSSDQNTQIPAGIFIGSGARVVATPKVMTQGNVSQTERTYDVAIRGDGFLRVQLPDGRVAYTRDGGFETDSQGRITTKEGYLVDPGITVPQNATSVSINSTGQVNALVPGTVTPQTLGQLTMSRFINPVGLESMGDNFYLETAGSGQPIDGTPGADGFGTIQQGYLEDSNVNAVTEIASMIQAQRAYELNSKVISGADQMLQATATMFRA